MGFFIFYFGYGNPEKSQLIELGSVTLVEFMCSILDGGDFLGYVGVCGQ